MTVERIRDFYHKLNGFSNLSQAKIYKLYTNERLQQAQHKKIPESKFIQLFFNAIEEGISKEDKIKRITGLYRYATRKYDIYFNDLRIDLGKKRY